MSIKLTDTQLLMLSAAAQREDRCIEPPPSLKGAAAQKIATKLVVAGLAKETTAKRGAHVWRRDDATGLAYALKVTPAGLMMIAIEDAEADEPAVQISPPATGEVPTNIVDHEAAAGNVAVLTVIAKARAMKQVERIRGRAARISDRGWFDPARSATRTGALRQ
jgi:hypothetical protein